MNTCGHGRVLSNMKLKLKLKWNLEIQHASRAHARWRSSGGPEVLHMTVRSLCH